MDKNQMLFYESLRFFIGPLVKLRLGLKIAGQENIPEFEGAVIASNHRSGLDPVILSYAVRNRFINYAAASWSWKIPLYRELHQWAGAFPLELSGGKDIDKQLSRGLELLKDGELVGIFPEGGDTILDPGKAEKIGPFKTGFARLALKARVPVIPVAIIGIGERRMPTVPGPVVEKFVKHPGSSKGYSSVIYKKAKCRIGVPLDLGDFYDQPMTRPVLDEITSKVRSIVVDLYNGDDLDRFLTGEVPFDFKYERVRGDAMGKLL